MLVLLPTAEPLVKPPFQVAGVHRPQHPRQAKRPSVDSDSDDDADEYIDATEFVPTLLPPPRVPAGGEEGECKGEEGREGEEGRRGRHHR